MGYSKCKPNQCSNPHVGKHGKHVDFKGEVLEGGEAEYECNPGYAAKFGLWTKRRFSIFCKRSFHHKDGVIVTWSLENGEAIPKCEKGGNSFDKKSNNQMPHEI